MTIGIEHQAYGSIGARAINNGTMTLEKESAKDPAKLGTNLVGMTALNFYYLLLYPHYGELLHHYMP